MAKSEANALQTDNFSSEAQGTGEPKLSKAVHRFHLGYLPGLDGLRGVAILAVVATHGHVLNGWAGQIGVDIFFVLSGFLITSLLIEEWEQLHSVSLKRFYARRALRLLPALVVMIVTIVIWHGLTNRGVFGRTALDGIIALFYSSNWMFALGFRQPAHVFAHTWTLSIEEQFYFWWPLVLLFLLRHCSSRASLLRWVALAIFLLFVEKVIIAAGMPSGTMNWLTYATDARADTLLIGCAIAIMLHMNRMAWQDRAKFVLKYTAWFIGLPGLILIGIPAGLSADFSTIGLHLVTGLLAALILMEPVVSEGGLLSWLLSRRWLVYVGKVSYGMYLWHYPIFSEVQARNWPFPCELAVEFGLTVLATIASFYLIEKPALKLKRRFSSERRGNDEEVLFKLSK
jgi:peptidoglycan/LPS O-acetylase OafA/YrhL